MAGILYGIGVGPGDPELMTLKAVRVIQECDIIGIPAKEKDSCTAYQIAVQAVAGMEQKPVLAVSIPMTRDKQKLEEAYEEGCRQLEQQLLAGKKIAFLNLGDPAVYGTYLGIHERIQRRGYEVSLISGVPSFCAVAAALGVALGSGREGIHILPGCYNPQEAEVYGGTRVLMKSAGRIDEVKRKLVELEDKGEIKAYAVTNCGMEGQKICREIRELEEDAGYFTTIIVKDR